MQIYRVMSAASAAAICDVLKTEEWAQGRARTPALTGTVKQNEEILQHAALTRIGKALINHGEIQLATIPLKLHAPKFSRYSKGAHYGRHTDAPWMGETRTDLSCTLWLNDDYEGGALSIAGQRIRGMPGECVIYDCGEPHEVEEVTAGERLCVITWIQSRIRDAHKRRLVTDMRRFLSRFETSHPEWFVDGGRVHSALIRMWME